jgi:mannose-6-phosphate isomerase-like protein (cupin superfamily)
MSYTLKNLDEVEDSAPKFGFEHNQEARFAREALDAERTGVSFHRIKPGQRQGFAHFHEQAEEVYVVIAGSGKLKLDDDTVEVGPLDAIRVAPQVKRAFAAGPDGLEIIACGAHHPGDGDLDMDGAGFWGDA